jgi:hypothetical protein
VEKYNFIQLGTLFPSETIEHIKAKEQKIENSQKSEKKDKQLSQNKKDKQVRSNIPHNNNSMRIDDMFKKMAK